VWCAVFVRDSIWLFECLHFFGYINAFFTSEDSKMLNDSLHLSRMNYWVIITLLILVFLLSFFHPLMVPLQTWNSKRRIAKVRRAAGA
jgi:hypothetical protein